MWRQQRQKQQTIATTTCIIDGLPRIRLAPALCVSRSGSNDFQPVRTCKRADTAVVGSHFTLVFICDTRSCTVLGTYDSNNPDNCVLTSSLYPDPVTQLAIRECHCCPSTVEMYKMPARLTVAGVAYLRSRISKIMRMLARSGIRSLEARVST